MKPLDEYQHVNREFARRNRSGFVSIETTRRQMWRRFFLTLCLLPFTLNTSLLNSSAAAAVTQNPVRVTLGHAVVALNGPWKFHAGDNPLWAKPNLRRLLAHMIAA
jgi:hypothetical protein